MNFQIKSCKSVITGLAVLLLVPAQVSLAQQPEAAAKGGALDAEGRPQAYLSLIAIGPEAKRRYRAMTSEERENIAGGASRGEAAELSAEELKSMKGLPVLMPPKEGELPPSSLMFADGKTTTADGKSVDKIVQLSVGFNAGGAFVPVPAGKPLPLKAPVQKGGREGYDDWFTVAPMQPGATKLLLMYPSNKGDHRWNYKPHYRELKADPASFPENQVLALNFTRRPVQFMIGADTQIIKPGGSQKYTVENARKLIRCVAAAKGYGKGYIINSGFRGDQLIRKIYIFHESLSADGKSSEIKTIQVNLPHTDSSLTKTP
ncbi:hypothetical protein Rhal01_00709 [Rubritalea halochordaticola]|uniref:Uncharacterized protein n=1 Tax=Rubritalea halochordaticola TaxID=714537 RepID=A0ABP9UW09_9BACT